MSWLARSLANSLWLDEEPQPDPTPTLISPLQEDDPPEIHGSLGVKEDLSAIRQTLTRQLWGVASFLAPPPPDSVQNLNLCDHDVVIPDRASLDRVSDDSASDPGGISMIRGEIIEIGGSFRTGISSLSNHKAVFKFSRFASNFMPFGYEEDATEYDLSGVVGITEEVLAFARNISMHPETWLDFPLDEEQDMEDFDMSDVQQEHTLAVEHLLPRLAALRIELCPGHMTRSYFWKVYFVLLHSRLLKCDAELLSTPQLGAARGRWMQELQKRTKAEQDCWPRRQTSYLNGCCSIQHDDCYNNAPLSQLGYEAFDIETQKYPLENKEVETMRKPGVEENTVILSKNENLIEPCEDDGDKWLQEQSSSYSLFDNPFWNGDDVSFSDLEDDDDGSMPVESKS